MTKIKQIKGFIIRCDENCQILEVKADALFTISKEAYLTQYADAASLGKLLSFFTKLKAEESITGWEVNFKIGSQIIGLYLAGIKEQNHYIVIGSIDVQDTIKYFNALSKINNQRLNELGADLKENNNIKDSAFNKLTEINNEMANLQRELAKKNHLLTALNVELEQKIKELDQSANIVSHDLKTPLHGIVGLINIISEEYSENFDDDLKEMFGLISQSASRMDGLITSILSYAKAGKTDLEVSTFDLNVLLKEIIDTINAPEGYRFIIPENLPELTCSYVQLSQVLTNLMGNAVKYHHKPEGIIEFKISKEEKGFYRISVIDDGPGIPKEYHDKLFGAFVTAHQESRTDSTGIGLAIVQKLVKQHGGEVGLISTLGKGATFWFTWPKK